MPETQFFLKI